MPNNGGKKREKAKQPSVGLLDPEEINQGRRVLMVKGRHD
jgi:hypothetical protein